MLARVIWTIVAASVLASLSVHQIDARTRLRRFNDAGQPPPLTLPRSGDHVGLSPFNPHLFVEHSERIVVDQGPGLDAGCRFRSEGDVREVRIPFEIKRAIGDLDKLIQNGLIRPIVAIELPVWDVDYAQGERDVITLNGATPLNVQNGLLEGHNDGWSPNVFAFDVRALIFPALPDVEGVAPTPAVNMIEIDVDVTGGHWCTDVDWVRISFSVASPVVMAHGLAASPDWFKTPNIGYEHFIGTELGLPLRLSDFRDASQFANGSIEHNARVLASDIAALKPKTSALGEFVAGDDDIRHVGSGDLVLTVV